MSTKYIKVAVTERLPIENGTYITSHGWNYWNGNKFEDESDKEIHYINYWFEEVPDNEADLRKENEEMKAMLERVMANLTFNEQGLYNEIEELLNKLK